ncbi:collagen alpha-2(I) chain-like [Agelaius tricolor]|uniref:collagen alpha-2(I) chain-like n=1 Tax=Agelaius tricolor TaxID=9191 RepID=UPI0039F243FF
MSSTAEPGAGQPRSGGRRAMRGGDAEPGCGAASAPARDGTDGTGRDGMGQDGTGQDGTGRDGPYLAAEGPGRTMLRGRAGAAAAAARSGAAAAPDAPSLLLPLRLQRAAKSAGASSEEEPPQWLPPARAGRSYSGGGGEAGGRAGGIHTSRPGMPPPRLTPRLPRRRPAAASRFPEARPGGHRRGEPAPHACVPAGHAEPGSPGRMLRFPPSPGTLRRMLRFPPNPGGCSAFPPPRALPGRMRRSSPRHPRRMLHSPTPGTPPGDAALPYPRHPRRMLHSPTPGTSPGDAALPSSGGRTGPAAPTPSSDHQRSPVVSRPDWCGMGRLKLYPERVRSQNFTKGIKAPQKAPGSQELQLWPTTGLQSYLSPKVANSCKNLEEIPENDIFVTNRVRAETLNVVTGLQEL